jgi:hypothetical protein
MVYAKLYKAELSKIIHINAQLNSQQHQKWLTSQGNQLLFQKVYQFVGPVRFHKQNTQGAYAISEELQKEHQCLGRKRDVRPTAI